MLKRKNRIISSVAFKEIFIGGEVKENECFKIIFRKNNFKTLVFFYLTLSEDSFKSNRRYNPVFLLKHYLGS